MEVIESLLKRSQENLAFSFLRTEENQIKNLQNTTKYIPNTDGLYLVFSEKKSEIVSEHLLYTINDKEYILCYFGKAGGTTKQGKILSQGLNGRINNVVSDRYLKLKDIKRAKYWNIIMQSNGIDKFYVRCIEISEPQVIEDEIYEELNSKQLKYPLMNKFRGRKGVKLLITKDNDKIINLKTNMKVNRETSEITNDSITVNNNSIEVKVKQNESAFDLIKSYNFKAKKYSIDIFETKNTNNYICTHYGSTSKPNTYFGNTDVNKLIDKRQPARWKVIKKEMIQKNIQEVTIRLRPLI